METLGIAPTVEVLYDIVYTASDTVRLEAVLPNLVPIILSLVDKFRVRMCDSGRHVLQMLKARFPRTFFKLHAGKFDPFAVCTALE